MKMSFPQPHERSDPHSQTREHVFMLASCLQKYVTRNAQILIPKLMKMSFPSLKNAQILIPRLMKMPTPLFLGDRSTQKLMPFLQPHKSLIPRLKKCLFPSLTKPSDPHPQTDESTFPPASQNA